MNIPTRAGILFLLISSPLGAMDSITSEPLSQEKAEPKKELSASDVSKLGKEFLEFCNPH